MVRDIATFPAITMKCSFGSEAAYVIFCFGWAEFACWRQIHGECVGLTSCGKQFPRRVSIMVCIVLGCTLGWWNICRFHPVGFFVIVNILCKLIVWTYLPLYRIALCWSLWMYPDDSVTCSWLCPGLEMCLIIAPINMSELRVCYRAVWSEIESTVWILR